MSIGDTSTSGTHRHPSSHDSSDGDNSRHVSSSSMSSFGKLSHPLSASILRTTKSIIAIDSAAGNNEILLRPNTTLSRGQERQLELEFSRPAGERVAPQKSASFWKKLLFMDKKVQTNEDPSPPSTGFRNLLDSFIAEKKANFLFGFSFRSAKANSNSPPSTNECPKTSTTLTTSASNLNINKNPMILDSSGLLSVNINMDEPDTKNDEPDNDDSLCSSSSSIGSSIDHLSIMLENTGPRLSNGTTGQHRYVVELRAVFLKIGDIDTLNEKFTAEAFIEAKWVDHELAASHKYNPDCHWNPKLYVLNSLGELKQQIWYNQYSIGDYEGNLENRACLIKRSGSVLLERRRLSGQFWQTLNLKNFPADVQQLTLSISTPKQTNEIDLVHSKDNPSSVNIKCFVDSQEWRLYRHINVREYLRDSVFSSETFPAVDLTISAARKPTFYYWNAFFLIFLITLASLSIFSIRCHLNANRIQTTCTLLLTSVTFKWITNRSLPTVSYMTSLDKYSIGCMLLLCVQFIWHSIISSIMSLDQKCEYPYSYYDYIAFMLYFTMFLLINFVFLFWLLNNAYNKRCELRKQEIDYTNSIIGKRSTRLKSMLYGI